MQRIDVDSCKVVANKYLAQLATDGVCVLNGEGNTRARALFGLLDNVSLYLVPNPLSNVSPEMLQSIVKAIATEGSKARTKGQA